jgi:hypothetical protein
VCVTVNYKVCKSVKALYYLYLSVIKRECVTKVLINPIIRTRTHHFVTHITLHVTIFYVIYCSSIPVVVMLLTFFGMLVFFGAACSCSVCFV